jgi:RND family efflux transporter MFP subunit
MQSIINIRSFAVVLLSFLAIGFNACSDGNAQSSTTDTPVKKEVETAIVKAVDYQAQVYATGRLSSKEEVKLSFKTGGIIRRIYVQEGQQVKKGQLLAELSLEEIQAQTQQATLGVQQAEISLANAELALERAERDYRNVEGLFRDSVATLEQMEDASLQWRNAKNQLEAARTGLSFSQQNQEVADFNLRYSSIKAPSNGTILMKLAEANELVGPGTPLFLFGSRNQAQVLKVNITDKDIIRLQLGDPAEISFDAYPNEVFRGWITEMASMADPYTGTYEVEIQIDSQGKKLLSGFIGSVKIQTKVKEPMVSLPVDALVEANGLTGEVFLVQEGIAKRSAVGIFKLEQDQLLIRSGVEAGDQVVVKGGGYLQDGDVLKVKSESNR